MRKLFLPFILAGTLLSCDPSQNQSEVKLPDNPFLTELNQPIDFQNITSEDIKAYAQIALDISVAIREEIKGLENPSFEELFFPYDKMTGDLGQAYQITHMLYWVSPDSASRAEGEKGLQRLDSIYNNISSDKGLYQQFVNFRDGEEYQGLQGHRKLLVDDIIFEMERAGVSLEDQDLERFRKLNSEITALTSEYSKNMNTANHVLSISKEEAAGIPESFLSKYENDRGGYDIPVMPATRQPVMNNASVEETRKQYNFLYNTRGAEKNLEILDQLVIKRDELGDLMGYETYAGYNLAAKMAKDPETVWNFIQDLMDRAKPKAETELVKLNELKSTDVPGESIKAWDIQYYQNKILKEEYNVDHELIREYFPMQECLDGMMELYQEVLAVRFEKVENASVWHADVEMYRVYDGERLMGMFYLDLFPRPNKESWFYGVPMIPGRETGNGYQVPVSMLLGNFTKPTEEVPSLLSYRELNTLFHEFGHIMDGMSWKGEFSYQSSSKSDFVEAMSQLFENWIEDFDIINSFARHYESGEPFPKEMFDNMKASKNVSSGLDLVYGQRSCFYDMSLYDKYDPDSEFNTNQLWVDLDKEIGLGELSDYNTQPQACWIHINTHPCYYYGYFWSEVYAKDMFTQFEENGLRDQATGKRYRELILANGTQRDIVEAVEEFLGRPSNNEAYLRSLGFEDN